jgi:hypothetical protein
MNSPGEFSLALDYYRNWNREIFMIDTVVDALIVDLLNWLATGERTYQEVLDVWRTSCPKLPVWEDARDRGFVAHEILNGCEMVTVTPAGFAFLQQRKTSPRSAASRPA